MDKLREIKQHGTEIKKSILKNCENHKEVYVYGAGVNGITVLQSLKEASINNISGFVVTDVKSKTVIDFSVTQIDEIVDIKKDIFIIVAVSDNIQHEIVDTLEKYQFKNYIVLKQEEIMGIA